MSSINKVSIDGGTTFYDIEDTVGRQLLNDTVGWIGKNKAEYTLSSLKAINTSGTWSGNKYTINGCEYTVTTGADGETVESINVNTPSATTGTATLIIVDSKTYRAGTYRITGCPGDDSNDLWLGFYVNGDYKAPVDKGSGTTYTMASETVAQFRFRIKSGVTVSNKTLLPMLSDPILDDTFVPYHPSVEQTLMDAEVVHGKNKLPNNAKSQQGSGVTYTVNSNGTYSVVGTASAITQLSNVFIAKENYNNAILTGIPQKNLNIYMTLTDTTTSTDVATDIGEGSSAFNLVEGHRYNCKLIAGANFNAQTPIIVSPMISTDGGAYEPYYIPLKDVVPNKADNSAIAPVENGATCQNPNGYEIGDHFLRNGGYFTVTSAIAYGETITEGTNCIEGLITRRQRLTSISAVFTALPAGTNEVIAVASGSLVAAITNNEIVSGEGVIVFQKNNSNSFKWYGIIGSTVFAMGVCQNNAYNSHRVVYKDTETAEVTNPHEDITLNTTYKYAVKNGKTVNFKVQFTLANDIASGSNVRLFDLPYLPNLQNLKFIVYDTTADQYTTKFVFVANTNGRVYISKGLTAGGYEISGTYICQ